MLVLEVIEGPDLGSVFPLPQNEPQLIGRSSEALPLSDPTISRLHAELTPDDGKWFLRDLNSANGTFVNGHLMRRRTALQNGDEVGCGATLFRLTEKLTLTHDPQHADPCIDTSAESIVISSPHSLESAKNHLRMVHRLTAATAGSLDIKEILKQLVAVLVDEFKPDRCVGVLFDNDNAIGTKIEATTTRLQNNASNFSENIIIHTCKKKSAIRIASVQDDVRFAQDDGVQKSGVRSALCAPLFAHGNILGAILLEITSENRQWGDNELELLSTACGHAGLALLTAFLADNRMQHERLAAMGETVASISHSVKNMLQGLRSGASTIDLALNRNDLELAKEGWPILSRNLDRVYTLTFNMLAWSRSQNLDILLEQLQPLIEDAVELVRGACERGNVKISIDIEPDMPPLPLDSTALLQALLNVLHNAIDATPETDGVVSIAARFNKKNGQAVISVTDNGGGIDEKSKETLFKAFHTTKGQRGTGLGLAVAKKILNEHGGVIELEKAVNCGTVCHIYLPTERDGDPGGTHGTSMNPS